MEEPFHGSFPREGPGCGENGSGGQTAQLSHQEVRQSAFEEELEKNRLFRARRRLSQLPQRQ